MTKLHSSLLRTVVRRFCLSLGTAGATLGSAHAADLPSTPTVVAGSVTIDSAGRTMNIGQHSDRAIVNWESFSIGADHSVNIAQPNTSSVILNRVTGQSPSQVMGSLKANGVVLLVNRNGVYFSRSAQVDVGSLVASTSDVADRDLMEGRLRFSGSGPGRVENAGTIRVADGGLAALVAPSVANSGVIRARVGRVALASGDRFNVDLYGDGLIKFELTDDVLDGLQSGDGQTLRTVLNQTGTISAEGGEVLLLASTAANIVDSLVNVGGIVEARSVNAEGGRIVLSGGKGTVNVTAMLDASSGAGKGGTIEVTGQQVSIASEAQVLASGPQVGGRVRIGGGFQGGEGIQSADTTTIAEGVLIDASSRAGAGGDVVVWSDDHTQFKGHILASGAGAQGGHVEVSGKKLLEFLGDVNAGAGGRLLLDPEDVFIRALGSTDIAEGSILSAAAINQMLRSGMDVVIDATNDISVLQAINGIPSTVGTASGNLTLDAGRSVMILRPIGTASLGGQGGAITVNAASNIEIDADAFLFVADATDVSRQRAGSAAITLNAGANITSSGQLFTLGRIALTASTGNVDIEQTLGGITGDPGIGSLQVDAGGNVEMNGVYARGTGLSAGQAAVAIDAGGSIENGVDRGQAESIIAQAGAVVLSAGDGMTLSGRGATPVAIEARGADSSVQLNATQTGVGALDLRGSLIARDADVQVGSSSNSFASVTMAQGTAIQALSAQASTQDSGISLYSTGAVTAEHLVAARDGDIHVESRTGDVAINQDVAGLAQGDQATGVGSFTARAGRNAAVRGVLLSGDGDIDFQQIGSGTGAVQIAGSLVTRGGNINVGSDEARFASIRMSASTSEARSAEETTWQSGVVSFYAVDDIAVNRIVAGSSSRVVLDSSSGSVDVDEAIAGIEDGGVAQGIGSLQIEAGQNVSLAGALTNGVGAEDTGISISAGTSTMRGFLTSTHALISERDVLLSSSGNMTLGGDESHPTALAAADEDWPAVAARGANASIVLTRIGLDSSEPLAALSLHGDLITNEGEIRIGSSTNPFSSVVAAENADLQTFLFGASTAQSGDISIYANNLVDVGHLLGGDQSDIRIAGGSAWLRQPIEGRGIVTNGTSSAAGVGSLWVSAEREIIYNGASTNRTTTADIAEMRSLAGDGFTSGTPFSLVLAAPNRVQVLGQTRANGNVYIGDPSFLSEEQPLDQQTQIFLNHNVFTGGGSATFSGHVSLYRWAPIGSEQWVSIDLLQLLGVESVPDADYTYDSLSNSNRFVSSTSEADLFDGDRDGNRRPQCGLDTRVYCWPDLLERLSRDLPSQIPTQLFHASDDDSWLFENSGDLSIAVANYQSGGNLALFGFTTSEFRLVNRTEGAISGFEPIAGYPIAGQQSFTVPDGRTASEFVSTLDPGFLEQTVVDAQRRVAFLSNLTGVMQVTVDTTGDGVGAIDFRGDVRSGVYDDLSGLTQWSQAAHNVPHTYVNQELVLRTDDPIRIGGRVGHRDALRFIGTIDNDTDGTFDEALFAGASTTGRAVVPNDALTLTESDRQAIVGTFGLRVETSLDGTQIPMIVDSGELYLHRLACMDCSIALRPDSSFNQESTILEDLGVILDPSLTSPGFQYLDNPSDRVDSVFTVSGVYFEAVGLLTRPGAGSGTAQGANRNQVGGYTGSPLVGDLNYGSSSLLVGSETQLGTVGSASGPPFDDLSGGSVGLPSSAEESSRAQTEDATIEVLEDEEEDKCPRGSAGYADVGNREGKTGAPADVFSLCKGDMQSTANATP